MLNLPIYFRNSSYYLHIRILRRQFKRSLHTTDRHTAIIRASRMLESIKMTLDLSKIRKYELNISQGIARADGAEDHRNMMQALESLLSLGVSPQTPTPRINPTSTTLPINTGLTLVELLDKYFLLKKVKPATVLAHRNTVKEFSNFFQKKCYLTDIMESDITRYQEFLATKGNVPRTIDGKVGYIKTLLNFAIKQGYFQNPKNPAENRMLLTKRQKLSEGYLIFEPDEIGQIYSSDYFKGQQQSDPDYYYVMLLALFTGCRISELTSLTKSQFQSSPNGAHLIVIRDAKTWAGKREIPLPSILFYEGLNEFLKSKTNEVFKYATRDGKGSGNAVGKKFARQLELLKINRGKLVFHSIRKFCNDFLMKNGVEYEPRCQFMGHEIEVVNVATYSKKFSADQLSIIVKTAQIKLLELAGMQKD